MYSHFPIVGKTAICVGTLPYSLDSYKDMKAAFADVDLGFALLNAPPAFVYRCRLAADVRQEMSCV